jgi:predicted alpha/beta-fold hydrolase
MLEPLAMIIFIFLAYCLIKQLFYTTSKVHSQENPQNRQILSRLGSLDFIPTFFLPNFILQLLYNEFITKPIIKYKREYLKTVDGGLVSLDWVVRESENFDKLLVLLHGITGGSNSCFIRDTIEGFKDTNYKIVVVQYRGVNDTPLLTPQTFHGGYTDDLLLSMRYIRSKYTGTPCYCMGQSMGANILTKFQATHYDEFGGYIKGFVSLSNPYDFKEIEKRNIGTWIEYFMVKLRQKSMEQHRTILGCSPNLDSHKIFTTSRYMDIEQQLTLNAFGYKSLECYYSEASCIHYLYDLKVPTLFISSRDDVLSPVDVIDIHKVCENEKLILLKTELGGHICYFTGFLRPKRWYLEKTISYFEALNVN